MTPVKVALLSLFMMTAIAMWGIGIYSADAAAGHTEADGYGVVATR